MGVFPFSISSGNLSQSNPTGLPCPFQKRKFITDRSPLFRAKKVRPREVKELAQGYRKEREGQS